VLNDRFGLYAILAATASVLAEEMAVEDPRGIPADLRGQGETPFLIEVTIKRSKNKILQGRRRMKSILTAATAFLLSAIVPQTVCAQISDDIVKIGVLTDMSSLYSDATGKGSVVATEMAVADFGAKVRGKPIQVISADHQNRPDLGVNVARTWYDTGHVDAIVDVPTSSVALPVSALTREKNRVLLASGAGTSDLTGSQCSLQHDPLDLRHICACQRGGNGHGEARRQIVVLHYCGLCVWRGARA
jgi:hypothetical protein